MSQFLTSRLVHPYHVTVSVSGIGVSGDFFILMIDSLIVCLFVWLVGWLVGWLVD